MSHTAVAAIRHLYITDYISNIFVPVVYNIYIDLFLFTFKLPFLIFPRLR